MTKVATTVLIPHQPSAMRRLPGATARFWFAQPSTDAVVGLLLVAADRVTAIDLPRMPMVTISTALATGIVWLAVRVALRRLARPMLGFPHGFNAPTRQRFTRLWRTAMTMSLGVLALSGYVLRAPTDTAALASMALAVAACSLVRASLLAALILQLRRH